MLLSQLMLSQAMLSQAMLAQAMLSQAMLSHSMLSQAMLSHAKLSQATLSQAMLSHVSAVQSMPPSVGSFHRSGIPRSTGRSERAKLSAGRSPRFARATTLSASGAVLGRPMPPMPELFAVPSLWVAARTSRSPLPSALGSGSATPVS